MADVERHRRIGVGVDQVWAALADFAAISSWAPNVDHSSILRAGDETSLATGLTRRVQVGRMTLLERVVRCDPETTLAYEIEGLPKIVRSARNAWRLEPAGAHATTATLTSTVDCGPRPPQKLIARIVTKRMAADSEKMLTGLAASLEHSRV